MSTAQVYEPQKDYSDWKREWFEPVPFTDVRLDDTFWSSRMETNRQVTIPFALKKCEDTGRIDNFAKAGGSMEGDFCGVYPFDDSDVYKIIEGAAYTLSLEPNEELKKCLDDLVIKIAAAQEDDGYLYTARTINPQGLLDWIGGQRWSNLGRSHELYNVGHMYEAAVAHYQATGERTLLDVAIKNANLIDRVFGPDKKRDVPGHQEIELGLVKLYHVTGEKRYLELAWFFLNERGRTSGRALYGTYAQDHRPVTEQSEAVGHAVRATYMYAAMADVAALTGDADNVRAIDHVWENVVAKKLYLTGGIGAHREREAFGNNYELPNKAAYAETCAAIGNAMWNHRMFLLHGDAKYLDVLERVLYNGFIAGVSLSGDEFFYVNPLESDGAYAFNCDTLTRSPWFDCSCCPSNVVRFIPSLAGYVYAHRDDVLYINLFVGGGGRVEMAKGTVRVKQETRYPWDGGIKITLEPENTDEFAIHVRIPGWARNQPVPSDLYQYLDKSEEQVSLKVNGKPRALDLDKGFARIRRTWKKGDLIELDLPMPIRRVLCHEKVMENVGKVALERGPIVYCAEWPDNSERIRDLILLDDVPLEAEYHRDILGGVMVIRGRIPRPCLDEDVNSIEEQEFVVIPYSAWSHRGVGEMAVWLSRTTGGQREAIG